MGGFSYGEAQDWAQRQTANTPARRTGEIAGMLAQMIGNQQRQKQADDIAYSKLAREGYNIQPTGQQSGGVGGFLRALTGQPTQQYSVDPMQQVTPMQARQQQIQSAMTTPGMILEEYDPLKGSAKFTTKQAGKKDQLDQAMKLRKEYAKESSAFKKVGDSFSRVRQSAKNPSPAGDLAMIFNYMKMLDPGSVVREGEFANAQNSAGVPERIRAMYNNVVNGKRLSDVQRNDFLERSYMMFDAQKQRQSLLKNAYTGIAQRSGLPVEDVIVPMGEDEQYEMPKKYQFTNEQEAMSANLPSGTIVYIGGRKARID